MGEARACKCLAGPQNGDVADLAMHVIGNQAEEYACGGGVDCCRQRVRRLLCICGGLHMRSMVFSCCAEKWGSDTLALVHMRHKRGCIAASLSAPVSECMTAACDRTLPFCRSASACSCRVATCCRWNDAWWQRMKECAAARCSSGCTNANSAAVRQV